MVDQEPTGDAWQTFHHLAGEVRRAADKVERDSQINADRAKAYNRKMRWWRRAAVAALLAASVGVWAGFTARYAVAQMRAQRAEARIVACEKDNDVAAKVNALNDRTQQLLRDATAAGNRSPEQQERSDLFLAGQLAEYERIKVPSRDCSPAAVAAYYERK